MVITELCNALTLFASDLELCENSELTLTATSIGGGVITWSDGIENGLLFQLNQQERSPIQQRLP